MIYMHAEAIAQFPAGTRVRGHQFRPGIVTGHANRSGLPLVKLDGETRSWATHPGQLMTEAAYQVLIAPAAERTA